MGLPLKTEKGGRCVKQAKDKIEETVESRKRILDM